MFDEMMGILEPESKRNNIKPIVSVTDLVDVYHVRQRPAKTNEVTRERSARTKFSRVDRVQGAQEERRRLCSPPMETLSQSAKTEKQSAMALCEVRGGGVTEASEKTVEPREPGCDCAGQQWGYGQIERRAGILTPSDADIAAQVVLTAGVLKLQPFAMTVSLLCQEKTSQTVGSNLMRNQASTFGRTARVGHSFSAPPKNTDFRK